MAKIGMLEMGTDTEERRYFRQQYLDRLAECGAETRVIPQHETKEAMERELEGIGGVLFPGGGDWNPERYGEKKLPCCGKTDRKRDRAEEILYWCAMERRLPVLGICRGIQSFNILEGGKVWQDLKEQRGAEISHSAPPECLPHQVRAVRGSLLEKIWRCGNCPVNSMHHQAISELAPGLTACAYSEDGLIEGVEKKDYPFYLGVQWHPEHLRKDILQKKLFMAFAEASGC